MPRPAYAGVVMVSLVHTLAAGALVLSAAAAPAAPGDLDRDFGARGKAYADFGRQAQAETANDVAVRGNGQVVAVGGLSFADGSRWALARWRPDGSLDRRFSSNGRAVTWIGTKDAAQVVLLHDGGRALAGGTSDGRFALVAYLRDGTLDTSWGEDGIVTTDLPGDGGVLDLRRLADGSYLAGGTSGADLAVAHYAADGALEGLVTSTAPFGGQVNAVQVLADGGLLATGFGAADDDGIRSLRTMRIDAAGAPDPTFGTGGAVTTYIEDSDSSRGQVVQLQPDGTVLVGGSSYGPGDYSYQVLARYLPDGDLDPTFARGGGYTDLLLDDYYAEILDLAVQRDGRIVTSGWAAGEDPYRVAVSRYTADGDLDSSFHHRGYRTVAFGEGTPTTPSSRSAGQAVALSGGRVHVVGGVTNGPEPGRSSFLALRLRQ